MWIAILIFLQDSNTIISPYSSLNSLRPYWNPLDRSIWVIYSINNSVHPSHSWSLLFLMLRQAFQSCWEFFSFESTQNQSFRSFQSPFQTWSKAIQYGLRLFKLRYTKKWQKWHFCLWSVGRQRSCFESKTMIKKIGIIIVVTFLW